MVSDRPTADSVLHRYRQLMRALHVERARRGTDPWHECPMTMAQLRALSLIAASQRGLSSRELAAILAVGASAITPLVDRLVERGFARRHEDPHDRRIARLEATDGGAALLERLASGQGEVIEDILAQLDPAELATVGAAIDILHSGLRRTPAADPDPPLLTPSGATA
jgi:DNA-binding MarR family transcriptional regulator